MSQLALGHRRRAPRRFGGLALLAGSLAVLALAGVPVAYMLWPQPAAVAIDAPALPITVGGVTFNVPPAAIRFAMQRRAGTQSRIDLAFAWPSLTPPQPVTAASVNAAADRIELLFVTIASSDGTLPPLERLKVIYPRYVEGPEVVGRDGLVVRPFRRGSPYEGEDLIYDPAAPERFLMRCTRQDGPAPGICLHERRIAAADVTVRLRRGWLADWRSVADRIDRLLAGLRPAGG